MINWYKFTFMFIFVVAVFTGMIFGSGLGEDEVKKVKCYDRAGHVIDDLTCNKNIFRFTKDQAWLVSVVIYPLLLLMALLWSHER